MTPASFLDLLWGQKPDGLYLLIWARRGKQSHWFRDIARAADFIGRGAGHDTYVGVGLSERDHGPDQRCKSDEVAGLAGFWADSDLRSEAHAKPLAATIEEAVKIIPTELTPTVTVATGNGLHAWRLFREPWIFVDAEDRRKATALSFRWQTLLKYNSTDNGWGFDRLADLARVLRIPGTVNAKDPNKLKPVTVHSLTDCRYNPSDFEIYLDEMSIPTEEAEEHTRQQFAERFASSPLVIDFNATISDDILAGWIERDMRFRNTWHRQRHDLSDQSGSGYDMALASFGVGGGLSDQQIVDLIIQHRRIHGEQRRTRLDYYQRAISKARMAEAPQSSSAGIAVAPPPVADARPLNATSHDNNIDKARLCEQLSRLLGVHLIRIVKVPGNDPVFLLELEEDRIEFSTARLLSQKAVSVGLAGKANKVIPTFNKKQWQQVTQMMLDACTMVDGTEDLELEGWARIQIGRYLSEAQFIESPKGATEQDKYKPLVEKGKIAVSALDLQTYLMRATSQSVTVKSVAAMLAAVGAVAFRLRGTGFKEQGRWALPVAEFNPSDYQQQVGETANGV
jgi:hypothetical protein